MKTGILTHYQIYNHGALLQMYALQRVLKTLGATPVILTYDKNFDFADKSKMAVYSKSPFFYAKYLWQRGFGRMFFNYRKYKIFEKFKKQHYVFAPLAEGGCDFACIGSDEVFSIDFGINKMMYGHGVNCGNVFSYAGSFGQTDMAKIKEKNAYDIMQSGFKTFKDVSVRDENSAAIVEQMTGAKPKIVCDPALLYGFAEELKTPCCKTPKQKYMIIYAYDYNMNEPQEVAAIKKYARKRGLKIVSVGFYHKWADKNINVSPLEFAQLFKNAQCAVTDTFHGSIFSILANIPFAAFVRGTNKNKMSYLLKTTAAQNARMDNWEDLPLILGRPFNWTQANAAVAAMRADGLEFIKQVLGKDAK